MSRLLMENDKLNEQWKIIFTNVPHELLNNRQYIAAINCRAN